MFIGNKQNKKGRMIAGMLVFSMSFDQLLAAKKDSKNRASQQTFCTSYIVRALDTLNPSHCSEEMS